jgi:hypothetical protein
MNLEGGKMRCRMVSVGCALSFAITGTPVHGQSRILAYDKAVKVCQDFEGLIPPAPPIGGAVVGTFDAQTAEFTWDQHVTMRKWIARDPLTEATKVDLGPVFDPYNIRAILPNLDPRITSLPSGIRVAMTSALDATRFRPGATVRGRPPTARARAQNPTTPGPGDIGGISRRPLRGHPPDRTYRMYLPVTGGMQDLVFKVTNLPQGASFSVTVDDRTVSAKAGQVDIVVPARGSVHFKVEAKQKVPPMRERSFAESVFFDRPPTLGCFTLEALPVAISYEPPGSGSSQTFLTSQQLGNVIKSFSGTESSSTQPVATPFSTVGDMIGIMGGVGQAVSGAASVIPALAPMAAVGQGLQTASSILGAAWGSSETTETNRYSVTNEHTLEVNVTNSSSLETSAHLGPGKGDFIQFLRKPVFVWLAATDFVTGQLYLSVSLLGFQGLGNHTAEDLRDPAFPFLPVGARKLLLALDPLTPEYQQAHPSGEAGRLVKLPYSISYSGGTQTEVQTRTITESDIRTETTSRNVTTTEVGGFLSYVATNVPQTGTTSMTSTHGGSKGVSVGNTVEVKVTLASAVGEYLEVETSYDRKFGTFAFVSVPVGDTVAAGMVASEAGAPRPRTRVEIVTAGRKFITWTDAQGRYAFRSRRLKPGSYELIVDGKRQPLKLEGKRVTVNVTVGQRAEVRDSAVQPSPGAERIEIRPRRK